MSRSNPFNPQYYGYTPAKPNQLFNGSAPFVYNYLPHDSQSCIIAKNLYNTVHSSIYSPDTTVKSHPAAPIIQGFGLKQQESNIQQHCFPSFKYDGEPATPNYGSNNYGVNNFGIGNFS